MENFGTGGRPGGSRLLVFGALGCGGFVLLVAAFMLGVVVGGAGTPAEQGSSQRVEEPETRAPSEGTIPGDGTFLVGDDIQPGTYATDGGDGCYWARLENASGDADSIIANGNAQGPTTVTISPSDGAFETNDCADWIRR